MLRRYAYFGTGPGLNDDFLFSYPGGGVLDIFDRTGMCRSNGSLFYKNSLNIGSIFYQKNP